MTGSVRAAVPLALLMCFTGGAAAQPAIRGTVHAPAGGDIHGTIVVACFAENGRCSYTSPHPRSRAVRIGTRGPSARYVIRNLDAGEYVILATRDNNGNGAEDAGDWAGQHGTVEAPRLVRPPAERIDLQLTALPAPLPSRREAPNPAAPPAPGRGGLSGIWLGVSRQLAAPGPGSIVASGITWTPSRDWMTFFPDGRVFLALPPRGVEGFDWTTECARSPSWCATYAVDRDRVTIRWASGETKRLARRDGMLWTDDRLNFVPLPSLDGLRLDGVYVVPWKEEHRPSRITFSRDGRFTEQNLLSGISWNSSDHGTEAARIRDVPGGSGEYDVRSNTLVLRYRDGRVVTVSIYIVPAELGKARPEEVYINAHDFVRVR
jgi:uncharacterized protein (DUF2141 family)